MCLHYFRGKGYSPEFIENMQQIVNHLDTDPMIQLVAGADSVCLTCPNRIGTSDCACDAKVLHYDQMVVDHCHLTLGTTLTWKEFFQQVDENILTPHLRESICGDCEWNQYCK